jgi:hypothetical protein
VKDYPIDGRGRQACAKVIDSAGIGKEGHQRNSVAQRTQPNGEQDDLLLRPAIREAWKHKDDPPTGSWLLRGLELRQDVSDLPRFGNGTTESIGVVDDVVGAKRRNAVPNLRSEPRGIGEDDDVDLFGGELAQSFRANHVKP